MRTMWLAVQAYEANQNLEITLEQPQDPEQWKQPPPWQRRGANPQRGRGFLR